MLALGLVRVAGEPATAAQEIEPVLPTRHNLVHVRLVSHIEQDPVLWRVKHPVQRQRELDDAQVGAKVATGTGDLRDQEIADLRRQHVDLLTRQRLEILRATDHVDQRTVGGGDLLGAHEGPV